MMNDIIEMGGSVLQQFGAAVLGVVLGYYGRGIMESSRGQRARRFADRMWERISSPRVMVLIVSLSFAMTAIGWTVSDRQKDAFIDCITEYNVESAEAQEPRLEARDARDAALADVVDAAGVLLLATGSSVEDSTADLGEAIVKFQTLTAEQERVAEENPYPDSPAVLCDGVN